MKCACGCGEETPLAKRNIPRYGHVKGQPLKWAHFSHANRKSPVEYLIDPVTRCWIWQRALADTGYGTIGGRYAHRVYYERYWGPIPDGLHVDHLCRVRACVNPEHLEPVTPRENKLRGTSPNAINARKTHCLRGHEFTSANTYIRPDTGARQCRACAAERENGRPCGWVRSQRRADASVPRGGR